MIEVYARLSLFPPALRNRLRFDGGFARKYGLRQAVEITFGGAGGPCFEVGALNEAVRSILGGADAIQVTALNSGEVWECEADLEQQQPAVKLVGGSKTLYLPLVFALHPIASVREYGFVYGEETRQLPPESRAHWLAKLRDSALADEDLVDLAADIDALPAKIAEKLMSLVSAESFETRRLVPADARYYERLIGVWRGSNNIQEYASAEFAEFVRDIVKNRTGSDLSNLTLAAGHPHVSKTIGELGIEICDEFEAQLLAIEPQDLPSLVCLIELHSTLPSPKPERIATLLDTLHLTLKGDAPECVLFSSFFSLTEGELARQGILQDQPAFWRRLASLAHAALLQRIITSDNVDAPTFAEAAKHLASETFAIRTLLDLQTEPRWLPSFASEKQLRLEFLGRATSAAKAFEMVGSDTAALTAAIERCTTLLGEGDHALVFLPGPAEGNLDSPMELPAELRDLLQDNLRRRPVDPYALQQLFSSELPF